MGLLFIKVAKSIKARCPLTKNGEKLNNIINRWIELFEREYKSTVGWMASKLVAKNKWQSKKNGCPLQVMLSS